MTDEPSPIKPPPPPAVGPDAAPAWPYALALGALVAFGIAFGLVALQARRSTPDNLDEAVLRWVVARRADWPGVTRFFLALTTLGNYGVSFGLTVAATAAIVALRLARVRGIGRGEALFFLAVNEGGELLNRVIKLAFRRDRPPLADRLVSESSYSFPSGHSAFAALFFGMIAALLAHALRGRSARFRIPAVGACLTLAFLLAASRVWLAVHYTTDVIGGLVLGFSWVVASWTIRNHLGARRPTRESESL